MYSVALVSTVEQRESVILTHTCVQAAQSSLALCSPMDCSPSGSSPHGILQAKIPEWVAMHSSRGSSQSKE